MSSRTEEPRDRHKHRRHSRDGSSSRGEKEHREKRRRSSSGGGHASHEIQKIKHVEIFYEKPPPGLIKEDEPKPEDCIPDLPGNESARDFLAHAPTRGLWMPLGKEVKVMQCWRCKQYGHRTGDRECPYFIKGNQKIEQFRVAHEDPMFGLMKEKEHQEKQISLCSSPFVQGSHGWSFRCDQKYALEYIMSFTQNKGRKLPGDETKSHLNRKVA
uniref:Retinitis pigmentosa 9 protein n=1 Tax=Leptobrachium leishanense TaxID=445787 RepID=A0A8C5M6A7_9ANUR